MPTPVPDVAPIDHRTIVRDAVRRSGGVAALARKLGIVPSAISNWSKDGIPAGRVGFVAAATGIPVSQLRPDLFPDPITAPSPTPTPGEARR